MNRQVLILLVIALLLATIGGQIVLRSVDAVNAIRYDSLTQAMEDLGYDSTWEVKSEKTKILRENYSLRSDSRIVGHPRWYENHNFKGEELLVQIAVNKIDGKVIGIDNMGWVWQEK